MAITPIIAGGISLPSLPSQASKAAQATDPAQFGGQVVKAMEDLDATNKAAENLAVQAATGDLQDAHDFMIASTRAGLATQLTVAVRNRAVEAFQSVMNMPV
jgi:flagellar hook-basal body complex protein FliE